MALWVKFKEIIYISIKVIELPFEDWLRSEMTDPRFVHWKSLKINSIWNLVFINHTFFRYTLYYMRVYFVIFTYIPDGCFVFFCETLPHISSFLEILLYWQRGVPLDPFDCVTQEKFVALQRENAKNQINWHSFFTHHHLQTTAKRKRNLKICTF